MNDAASPHRIFWLTTGLATLTAALIGAIATLIAAHHNPAAPAATSAGAAVAAGTARTSTRAGSPAPADRFVAKYTGVTFRLPHPAKGDCQDATVSFEGESPQVDTEWAGAADSDISLDLVYDDCNTANQLWLIVPQDYHAFARVNTQLDAAGCADAANLQRTDMKQPADAVKAGQHYCLRTLNGYIVQFSVLSVSAQHDLQLRASTWLDRTAS